MTTAPIDRAHHRTPHRRAVSALAAGALLFAGCAEGAGGDDNDFEIVSTPGLEAVVGTTWTYSIALTLFQGPKAFELEVGPPGMTISAQGLVEWTPQYADLGSHPVRIEASTPNESDEQSFTLRVSQGARFGTTLSPRGHVTLSTAQDYVDYYAGHATHGQLVAFHSSWRDGVSSAGQIPALVAVGLAAAATYDFTPVIGLGWTDGAGNPDLSADGDPTNSWFNAESRAEFVGLVTTLVTNHQVPYLFLGNETNAYWLKHTQAEWDEWIDVLGEAYLAIKTASPQTMVYTTLQLERMKGLGAHAGWTDPPHFQLIADHAGLVDALGFTSYPYLEYDAPLDVPADHYTEIATHWTGPVIISELGWLASPEGPYPGDPFEQAAFPGVFFDRTQTLDLEACLWLFLHDFENPASIVGFGSIGMRTNDGLTVRPVDANWQSEVGLRQAP